MSGYTYEEFIAKKRKDDNDNKESSFIVLLPNLRFKENNKKLYFYSKNPIKLTINNKIVYKNEFELNDISLNSSIIVQNINFNCEIIEEELNNGLKMKVKYKEINDISIIEMQKISRSIETTILNIDTVDDNYEDYYEDLKNHFENSSELYEDNSEEEIPENKIEVYNEINQNINDDIEDPIDKFNKKNNLI